MRMRFRFLGGVIKILHVARAREYLERGVICLFFARVNLFCYFVNRDEFLWGREILRALAY